MNYSTPIIVHVFSFLATILLFNQNLYLRAGDDPDKKALLEFRKAIEDTQNVLWNWNDATRLCDWDRISCSQQGRVTELALSNASLHGTISPFLFNLSHLEHLDLSCNFLHGAIPDSFGKLAHLAYLNLSANGLEGALPASIFNNCSQLASLDLTENLIDGAIPLSVVDGYMNTMEKLFLGKNRLTGTIPASISNLSQLNRLDLSSNHLQESIPVELGALSRLVILALEDNQLQHGIPDSLGMLADLIYLDLARNELVGNLPPSVLYNCTRLKTVDFSNNSFHGPIPPAIGNYLSGLRELLLGSNNLTGSLPASLANATNLALIVLDFNQLTGQLPADIIARLPFLETFLISYNRFTSEEQGKDLSYFFRTISNLTKLVELGMGGNGIRGTLDSMADHLNYLSKILLQENRIRGAIPSNISNLRDLTWLNLSGNLLEGTIPLELFLLPKLERAWLSDNLLHGQIPALPNNISTHLGDLDLSRNNLSGKIPFSISNLTGLRFLQLSENIFDGSVPSSLGSLHLELLDLSHNRLNGILPQQVASLSSMTKFFDLSNNLLEGDLPLGLSNMVMVHAIFLSSNNFVGKVPPELGSCLSLERLDLSNNSLQGEIPDSLADLQDLQFLNLSFNRLSGQVPASLVQCTKLKELDLSFNQLSGNLPHGGVFDSLTFKSLEGNHFCGWKGFPSCDARKRSGGSAVHSRKFIILVASGITCILSILAIFSLVAAKIVMRGRGVDRITRNPTTDLFSNHPRITYRELSEATGGFDENNLVGSGGFGRVYRGTLSDGSLVAIKVLHLQDPNYWRTFERECQVLKRIRHRNLMGIVTACSLPEFKALVLPFMSKGSLEDHLYPQEHGAESRLSLAERLSICSDVAEGMAYLHHHAPLQVIHCDLKPSNILLTDDMTAVVSDFGIARLVGAAAAAAAGESASAESISSSTAALLRGSIGYVAPEYGYGRRASAKGDVYSFGIVVLGMVTGKRPTDAMFMEGVSLIDWVKSQYRSQLEKILDAYLVRELREQQQIPEVRKILEVAIMELIELGLVCAQEAVSARPNMMSIADDLNKLKQYLAGDATATFASSIGLSSTTTDPIADHDW